MTWDKPVSTSSPREGGGLFLEFWLGFPKSVTEDPGEAGVGEEGLERTTGRVSKVREQLLELGA